MNARPSSLPVLVADRRLASGGGRRSMHGSNRPRFPHQVHLAGLECGTIGKPECLNCNSCHSVSKKDRAHKLPQSDICTGCHRDDAHEILPVLAAKPERIRERSVSTTINTSR